MNNFKITIIVALAAIVNGWPASPILDKSTKSVIIGDILYSADSSTTLRSRVAALEYCKSQGAELAKITNKSLFDTLCSALSEQGTYWIDGIDKSTPDRFEINTSCTPGKMDLSEMFSGNLVLLPKQCLALVKGTTASNSRIQSTDCIIPNRVLCSYPINGCTLPTTSRPT